MSSTIFDGVMANSVTQNVHYEKVNLLSKLVSYILVEVICAIGIGVAGLFSCYHDNQPWLFNKYSMTSVSICCVCKTRMFCDVLIMVNKKEFLNHSVCVTPT